MDKAWSTLDCQLGTCKKEGKSVGSSSNEDSLSLLSIRIKLTSCHLVFISPSVSTCMQSPCPPYCPLCPLSLCLYISLVLSIRQNKKINCPCYDTFRNICVSWRLWGLSKLDSKCFSRVSKFKSHILHTGFKMCVFTE